MLTTEPTFRSLVFALISVHSLTPAKGSNDTYITPTKQPTNQPNNVKYFLFPSSRILPGLFRSGSQKTARPLRYTAAQQGQSAAMPKTKLLKRW